MVTEQPLATSAVARALYPEEHDQSGLTRRIDELIERVELLAVIEVQTQRRLGRWVKDTGTLPRRFSDLFDQPDDQAPMQPAALLPLEQIDQLMGWQST